MKDDICDKIRPPITSYSTYGHIVAEDLNIKGMVKDHYLAKLISDVGWGQFLNYLAYKAEEAGCKSEKTAP